MFGDDNNQTHTHVEARVGRSCLAECQRCYVKSEEITEDGWCQTIMGFLMNVSQTPKRGVFQKWCVSWPYAWLKLEGESAVHTQYVESFIPQKNTKYTPMYQQKSIGTDWMAAWGHTGRLKIVHKQKFSWSPSSVRSTSSRNVIWYNIWIKTWSDNTSNTTQYSTMEMGGMNYQQLGDTLVDLSWCAWWMRCRRRCSH